MTPIVSTMNEDEVAEPPGFADARSLRQRACAAGLDPSYWYAVEWDAALGTEKVIGVTLREISVAVYRGRDGRIRAIEDRCAHRHVKLSHGLPLARAPHDDC